MTELRRQMLQAMTVRGLARRTMRFDNGGAPWPNYGRSPEQITAEEIQSYLARMIEVDRLSWSTCSVAANAFRFLYHVTLGLTAVEFEVPRPKQPQRLPEILSREDVSRLLAAVKHEKHRLVFETIYACGLRVSEAIHLKVRDLDRDRMTVRIDQGKGGKDRYVPLSKRLLHRLEQYWADEPPRHWVRGQPSGAMPPRHRGAEGVHTRQAGCWNSETRRGPCLAPRLRDASHRIGCRRAHGAASARPSKRFDDDALLSFEPGSDRDRPVAP